MLVSFRNEVYKDFMSMTAEHEVALVEVTPAIAKMRNAITTAYLDLAVDDDELLGMIDNYMKQIIKDASK